MAREIADQPEHAPTGVAPAERFAAEARALRPLAGRAPFGHLRDLIRRGDCAIDLDTNSYSVPWRVIGESVQIVVLAGRAIIRHAGQEVGDHAPLPGAKTTDRGSGSFCWRCGGRCAQIPSRSRRSPYYGRLRNTRRLSEGTGDDELGS